MEEEQSYHDLACRLRDTVDLRERLTCATLGRRHKQRDVCAPVHLYPARDHPPSFPALDSKGMKKRKGEMEKCKDEDRGIL